MTYTAKQKINLTVTFKGSSEYSKPSYSGWGLDYITINKFEDAEGNQLIWRTGTGTITIEHIDEKGYCSREWPNDGAKIQIKGTVKSIGEYKGQPQVELTRVKLVAIVEQTKTHEELEAEKAAEQRASIKDGDKVWRMPYRQYKEHYADCETVAGSYDSGKEYRPYATIEVIIREGRLKNSGTRFQTFGYFNVTSESGKTVMYKAISYENAMKHATREYPEEHWVDATAL